MLPHQSVFLGEDRGNVYIQKISMNQLSSKTQLKTLHVWRKFSTQWVYFKEERWPSLILQVRKERYVNNTWSDRLYQNWFRIDSELYVRPFFQRGACRITPLVLLWKRLSFVLQKYVKKLSCLFTVTKRLVLLCTWELREHRFFKKEFIQQILHGTHYLDIHQFSHIKRYWEVFSSLVKQN